jgi:glycosyltransferase involved in cell wall biosynthesis
LLFYLSYMLTATVVGALLAKGRYDVIYATSPPLFTGASGLALSLLRRTPLVFEVRDLWPESAVVLGELTNPRAIAMAEWLERTCYHQARHIVVTSQELKDHLANRNIPDKITVIRNGANTDLFRFDPSARARIRHELGLQNKFVVVYAGLLGIAQALPSVIEAARLLEKRDPAVHWLIIGDGPLKEALVAQAGQLGLTCMTFMPAQPRLEIPGFLSAGDVALIPLVRQRLVGAVPSKMFDAMACERPILLSAETEAVSVLGEAKAGISVPPESPQALADAVLVFRRKPQKTREYGPRGREAVVANYSRQAQAQQLEELLRTLVSSFGPQADVV